MSQVVANSAERVCDALCLWSLGLGQVPRQQIAAGQPRREIHRQLAQQAAQRLVKPADRLLGQVLLKEVQLLRIENVGILERLDEGFAFPCVMALSLSVSSSGLVPV